MFIRQVYYFKDSGKLFYSYSMNYDYTDEPLRLNFKEVFPDIDLQTIDIMEWLEPDEEIESKFNEGYMVSVDVSIIPHQLVFTKIPKPEELPEDEQFVTTKDCLGALEEVGVI